MVEFINYEGKKLPIRIKYFALLNFQKETGKTFDEVQADTRKAKKKGDEIDMVELFNMMQPLLYYSLISGLKAVDKKAKLAYDREDMFDILEECFVEFTELMPKFFPDEAKVIGADVKGADDDGKKQLTNFQPKKKKRK